MRLLIAAIVLVVVALAVLFAPTSQPVLVLPCPANPSTLAPPAFPASPDLTFSRVPPLKRA